MYLLQARHAEQAGADAISCVGPTYFKPETMGELLKTPVWKTRSSWSKMY